MAITNAQQYQQLVNKPANGKRPGYKGREDRDSQYGGGSYDSSSNRSGRTSSTSGAGGGSGYTGSGDNRPDPGFQNALRQQKIEEEKKKARDAGFRTTGSQVYSPPTFFQSLKNKGYQSSIDRNKYLALQKTGLLKKPGFTGFTTALIDGLTGKVPDWAKDMTEEELNEMAFDIQGIKDYGKATYNYNLNPTKKGSGLELLGRTFDAQDILDSGEMTQSKYEELFPGPTLLKDDGGGGNEQQDPCKGPNPPAYCFVGNDTEEDATPTRNLGGLAPRFAGSIFDFTGLADGGRAGMMDGGMMEDTPEGGIMDLESGRQMYFLGKLVKKASRAVKKVVKSPIGKAALMYFGGNALMGAGGGGGLSSFFKSGKGLSLKNLVMGKPLGFKTAGDSVARSGGLLNFMKDNPYLSILGGSSILAGLSGKGEDEGEIDYGPGIDIDRHRYAPYRTLAPGIIGSNYQTGTEGRKDGGRMGYAEGSKEPVAKETMPLLDMDGKEKDYREDGGFVPIGRMERADDVPARLSKNEFVFTADAVRNAGEGDIDKGAEVMYNMMKNLESGGEVSEESQGLDGAREMFQTSQRLEEVL